MTSDKQSSPSGGAKDIRPAPGTQSQSPEWANGLRQLYDSVVDEDLPDSFKDLLAKLDTDD